MDIGLTGPPFKRRDSKSAFPREGALFGILITMSDPAKKLFQHRYHTAKLVEMSGSQSGEQQLGLVCQLQYGPPPVAGIRSPDHEAAAFQPVD